MNWEEKRLDELGQIIDSLHKTPKYSANGFPMVRVTDIKSGYLKLEGTFKVSEAVFQEFSAKHKSQKGDIVMSRVGTYGVPSLVDSEEPFCLGQNTLFVSNTKTPKFIFYSLQSPYVQAQIEAKSTGASQKTISLKSIRELAIPCPPLPTQHKIASILSAYDDLIENNLKRIRLLEEAAGHLYREWFVRFRFPGWEEVKVVDGLPDGWERKTLGKICIEISSGGTPDRGNPLYWASPEISWVKTKELRDEFVFESEESISKEGLENSSAKTFPAGTILMAIYASPTLGRLGILTNESCFNQAMVGFKIDRNQISTEFLYYKLLEERENLNNMAIGAAQQNINVKKVKDYEVILPSIDLINEFAQITSPFFSQRKTLGIQNQKLKEARDILLPRLMNQTIEV
jgi:type I restriction enzyme S subunit